MIGRLNHVAIAVQDLDAACAVYRDTLGAKITAPLPQPEHGVTVVFVELPNSKIELMAPLGEGSSSAWAQGGRTRAAEGVRILIPVSVSP